MRLIEKLIAKRDAALVTYEKWARLVELLQEDPDFMSIVHYGTTKKMTQAKQQHAGTLELGDVMEPLWTLNVKKSAAAKKLWTPERRAKQSRRMTQLAKEGKNPSQLRKKAEARDYLRTPEYRAAQAARMRKLWQDKREVMLKGARKGSKAGVAAIKAG